MSQRRLGQMLHEVGLALSVSGLSRLEKGDRPVTVDELALLADVLDQSPADLLEQETVVTGTGDLRMRLDERHEHADAATEPPEPAPAPVMDPRMLDLVASWAIGNELRTLMEALAATTVTRSQGEQLRLLTSAVSATLGSDLIATMDALGQVGRREHRRPPEHRDEERAVARRA